MGLAATATPGSERLSAWTKFKFAFAGMGGGMADMPQQVLLIPFYTELFGVPPYLAGLLALVTGVCEAISDPLLGWLSDHTRTRLGRRRPYLLAGAVPFGFSFWLLWNPVDANPVASFLFAWLIFRLSITTLIIPLYALGAEMSPNYDERTSIMGYFRGLVALGLLLGVVVPTLLLRASPTPRQGYAAMGLILGAFLTVSMLVSFFGTREQPTAAQTAGGAAGGRAWRAILRNRAFWSVTIAGLVLAYGASAVTSTLLVYYGLHWLHLSQAEVLPASAVFLIASLVSIPLLWTRLSRRYDKRGALAA
ncbi:MAG: MFS transporter, partial [Chloroflexota bacterium]